MPRRHRALLAAAVAACLAGCRAPLRLRVGAPPPAPTRLALAPVRVAVRIKKWGAISSEAKPADEAAEIQAELQRAADDVSGRLLMRLAESGRFVVVADTAPADARLDVTLSGYGRVKNSWLAVLIGSGVAEGAAEGVLVAQAANPWIALGVAVEEAGQEALEWGGGGWAFNRLFTPVILEARLSAGGRSVWTKTVFESSNSRALKGLPKDYRRDRGVRLAMTRRRAADTLAEKLLRRWGR